MKEFNSLEKAAIKRTAANVDRFINQRNKKQEKIQELAKEVDDLQVQIDAWEAPIKTMTGGYTTEELVEKEVKEAGVDKNGKPVKTTKFVLKYPDTIIPDDVMECDDNNNSEVDDKEVANVQEFEPQKSPFNPLEFK